MSTVAPEPVKQEVGIVGCVLCFLFVCTSLLVKSWHGQGW